MDMQTLTTQTGRNNAVLPRTPMETHQQARTIPRQAIQRDIPRYVILAADLLIDSKKRDFRNFTDIELGGSWHDLAVIPALHRFQGFVTRGRITPLLKNAVRPHASDPLIHDKLGEEAVIGEGEATSKLAGLFRQIFPYDSLMSLQSAAGHKGLVAVPEFEGVDYESGLIGEVQNFIFEGWGQPGFTLPTLLTEFESLIDRRSVATSESLIKAICGRFLESARVFRIHANEVIDNNLLAIDRNRSQTSGHHQPITERSRLYAAQLNRSLDEDRTIVVQAGTPSTPETPQERSFKERELAVRERELALKEAELNGASREEAVASVVDSDNGPVFSMGDKVLAGGREGIVVFKPGGRITVQFPDETKATFEKAEVQLADAA